MVAAGDRQRAAVESLAAVVAEELNVKAIEYVASASELVNYVVKPNYRTLGPKFGKNMPAVATAVAALPADETGDRLGSGRSVMVKVEGREYEFTPDDFVVEAHERDGFRVEREGGLAVAISTRLSPALLREGLARELVHHIQNTRKAADFQIDDRIRLRVSGPAEIAEMLSVHGDWVKKETLAVSLEVNGISDVPAASRRAPAPRSATATARWRRRRDPRRLLPRGPQGQWPAGDGGGGEGLRERRCGRRAASGVLGRRVGAFSCPCRSSAVSDRLREWRRCRGRGSCWPR